MPYLGNLCEKIKLMHKSQEYNAQQGDYTGNVYISN